MCVSNNINPVFNLSSYLSICFHQFPNPFVLFITFKSDNGVDYNLVIFQIALALGNMSLVVRKLAFGVSDQVRQKPAVQPQKMARDWIFRI